MLNPHEPSTAVASPIPPDLSGLGAKVASAKLREAAVAAKKGDSEARDALLTSLGLDPNACKGLLFRKGKAFKEHQWCIVQWGIMRESCPKKVGAPECRGALMAAEQGTGKTLMTTAISAIHRPHIVHRDGSTGKSPTLVICAKTLLRSWKNDCFDRFLGEESGIKVLVFHRECMRPQSRFDAMSAKDLLKYDIVISTYDVCLNAFKKIDWSTKLPRPEQCRGACAVYGIRWLRVVCDESMRIANPGIATTHALNAIDGIFKWCLSGTPITNTTLDLWSQMRFIGYRRIPNANQWKEAKADVLKTEYEHMRRAIVRFCISDCGPDMKMPERRESVVKVRMNTQQRCIYMNLIMAAKAVHGDLKRGNGTYAKILAILTRMRQAAIAPHAFCIETGKRPRAVPRTPPSRENPETLEAPKTTQGIARKKMVPLKLEPHRRAPTRRSARTNSRKGQDESDQEEEDESEDEGDDSSYSDSGEEDGYNNNTDEEEEEEEEEDNPITPSQRAAWILDGSSVKCLSGASAEDIVPCHLSEWCADRRGTAGLLAPKIQETIKILSAHNDDDKVIIFSSFASVLGIVAEAIDDVFGKGTCAIIDQRCNTIPKRNDVIDNWRDPDGPRVLLLTYAIGSAGLNLIEGNVVICLNLWWNAAVIEQAVRRAWRLGQEKTVHIYVVVAEDAVEDMLMTKCVTKCREANVALPGCARDELVGGEEEDIDAMISLLETTDDLMRLLVQCHGALMAQEKREALLKTLDPDAIEEEEDDDDGGEFEPKPLPVPVPVSKERHERARLNVMKRGNDIVIMTRKQGL
ncbi:putative helicase 172L [Mollivirus sibericum]|uniref:putative helicase 172L n=1 Tax=Mollivirus sibericum TaxID=1678078 RepID=UPI0006B2DCC2|nr:putative helicase 172L [Mollivirus sibericum]ALD62129.1 putative helicase 172L [Mollivirus sibericum]